MPNALTLEDMSPKLQKVVDRARREPQGRFHSLAHLIDVPALMRAYDRQRASAAVGVDGITKGQYGQDLGANLQDLHARLKAKTYRHQPIRRVHIPKGQGKTRPIGISAFEDKLVQDAVREVLEAVYEQDFLDCSYGFRPSRSAHDAVRALTQSVYQGKVNWILEADIESFFDSLDRTELKKMLEIRVADGSLLRLIGKCLHVGVLEGESLSEPDLGTVQGSVLSPLMGNVYLHYVLDLWFETEVKPRLRGRANLIRYCDDFIIGFERQDDAHRVQAVLGKRMARFGLTLHPDKTRLLPFGRPSPRQQSGKGPATFDFLGFTFYWTRSRRGRWRLGCKTRRSSLRKAKIAINDWCRRHRHLSIQAQHAALCRRLQGHFNYFGVNGNAKRLQQLVGAAKSSWFKWLRRRGQRRPLTWKRYTELLRWWPLPRPRVRVQIWGSTSTSRIGGGAGWWKSPSPDLARGRRG
jgi:group II intron reverse transcriptase/maturase